MSDDPLEKSKLVGRGRSLAEEAGAPARVPMGSIGLAPPKPTRPAAAVAADLNRLGEAMREQSTQNAPAEEPAPEPPKEKKEDEDEQTAYSLFDERNISPILNKKYRRRCEANLVPIDAIDLIVHGEARQEVPILFNKDGSPALTVVFRTVTGVEDLGVKYDMLGVEGPTRYIMDRFSIAQACIGIFSIGGKELSPFMKGGEFDPTLWKARLNSFLKRPHVQLSLLVQHYIWFCERVQDVGVAEALGNG